LIIEIDLGIDRNDKCTHLVEDMTQSHISKTRFGNILMKDLKLQGVDQTPKKGK